VKPVDVLRDERLDEAARFELGESKVAGVRPRPREDLEPQRVELPDLDGITPKSVDGRVLHRVVLGPDAAR
jgi:hypothetical protein